MGHSAPSALSELPGAVARRGHPNLVEAAGAGVAGQALREGTRHLGCRADLGGVLETGVGGCNGRGCETDNCQGEDETANEGIFHSESISLDEFFSVPQKFLLDNSATFTV